MKKILKIVFGFIFTGRIVHVGLGLIWAVSAWELVFGGAPPSVIRVAFWVILILGSGVLLGAIFTFLEEGDDDSPKRKL